MSTSSTPWYLRPERGSVLGLRVMMLFYRLCGKLMTRVLLYPVVALFFLTDRAGRRHSREFFERVYRSSANNPALKHPPGIWDDFKRFYNFGSSMVDRLEVWGGSSWMVNVSWHGLEHFENLQEQDGAVVLSAHIGNLDAMRVAAKEETAKTIKALVYTKNADQFMKVLKIINPDTFQDVMPIQEVDAITILQLKNLIDNGDALGLLADRIPEGSKDRVTEVPFLGKKAPFPQGPWILAGLLKCPIYTIFCVHTGHNNYEVFVEPFADKITLPRQQRDEHLQHWISLYALRLEKFCCQFPHHWFNFYDFWASSKITKNEIDS